MTVREESRVTPQSQAPPVGFEPETNGFRVYAIANLVLICFLNRIFCNWSIKLKGHIAVTQFMCLNWDATQTFCLCLYIQAMYST